jgi:hypothetical protein
MALAPCCGWRSAVMVMAAPGLNSAISLSTRSRGRWRNFGRTAPRPRPAAWFFADALKVGSHGAGRDEQRSVRDELAVAPEPCDELPAVAGSDATTACGGTAPRRTTPPRWPRALVNPRRQRCPTMCYILIGEAAALACFDEVAELVVREALDDLGGDLRRLESDERGRRAVRPPRAATGRTPAALPAAGARCWPPCRRRSTPPLHPGAGNLYRVPVLLAPFQIQPDSPHVGGDGGRGFVRGAQRDLPRLEQLAEVDRWQTFGHTR